MGDAAATTPGDKMSNGVDHAGTAKKPAKSGQSDELQQLLAEAHAASLSKRKPVSLQRSCMATLLPLAAF